VLLNILKVLRTLVLPTRAIRTLFLLGILILIRLAILIVGSLLLVYYLNILEV